MTRTLEIDETVIIRNLKTFIDGAKKPAGRNYLRHLLNRLVESSEDLILMEVCRVSQRKYQLCFVITEDNSHNVESDNIFFTADWYDIRRLKSVRTVKYQNALLGECEELRPSCEAT